tara:strand:- start:9902 stop:10795 length:894 start_codon:yes stop_codon:yes gene_type:complete
MVAELALGTAQFGLNYGITNQKGIITENESLEILKLASGYGLKFIDTAQNYGYSEEILGKTFPKNNKFRVVTKMKSINLKPSTKDIDKWEKNFFLSLKNLNLNKLDSFLLHDSSDFKKPYGKELINWLISLKKRNLIRRIGVSIYSVEELQHIPINLIEIIQLPLSIYDQRLIRNGTLETLISKGIAVHVRSIFLQGLLLQESNIWPSFLTSEFISHHREFTKEISKIGSTALIETLNFALRLNVEAVVVGISSLSDFQNILKTYNLLKTDKLKHIEDYSKYSWDKSKDIDPRLWKK